MSEKTEQISHQNEHRNYCSLSVPVILSSPKKGKEKDEVMFYPNTSSYQHQKPSRKKAKQNQNINTTTCPLLYYYCLCKSINELFLKIAPENRKRMQR